MSESIRVEPMDRHNEALVNNVHPSGWVNPTPADRYNMVVIGAGTAGLVTAAGAVGVGAKVALIERYLFGGDCLNTGCVPSKSIIRCARAAADVKHADRFGLSSADDGRADFSSVMERMREIRSRISEHDSVEKFRRLGIDVFLGDGRFTGPDTIEVAGQTLRFARACIASGARAVHPAIDGLGDAGFLTNETVFSLTSRPDKLAVLGGGPLGCELAQAFVRLGSEVVIMEKSDHLLPREDRDAAEILAKSFAADGIEVMRNSEVCGVKRNAGRKIVCIRRDGREEQLAVDEILVGAGRAPNVEGLNLPAASVEYDSRKGVHVDDRLRTSNPRIYAAGDVCLRHKFTHTADAAARIVIQNALFWGRKKLSTLTVPWCTYTDPEIAHVGMYAEDAERKGIAVETFMERFAELDRAMADGEEEGLVKVHVRKGTGRILGATIVARHAGEMINELTLAIVANVPLTAISGVIHPYPTQAEAIRHVADACSRTRLTPRIKWLFDRLMALRR